MEKRRIDIELVRRGIFSSRERAVDAIKNRQVQVAGKLVEKPSFLVAENSEIVIGEQLLPYVSKGGLKLEKAIKVFHLDFKDKTVLDVGCSTGGFADCALQHGAKHVYGIDVGVNQLAPGLQHHPQLTYIEGLNVKDLLPAHLNGCQPDWVVADLSFISLTYMFEYVKPLLHQQSKLLLLIKPQFELDAASLDKNGIVRNIKHHIAAIDRVVRKAAEYGMFVEKIDYAPLMSYKKNIEYITLFSQTPHCVQNDYTAVVDAAFWEKKKMK
ncbi:MAG: TlyA family RNA methyltransferase [Bacteroidales bacterium]|nr:TlyA family RNA methyltransferase [Bacteroidales bacterium]